MAARTQGQKDRFWNDGVLVIENAVSAKQLEKLRGGFGQCIEQSRAHCGDYGQTLDGRPQFDLQPGSSAEVPALRTTGRHG